MELTSKQRAFLKKESHALEPVVRIGKDGLSENVVKSLLDAIDSRELVKVKILQNSDAEKRETANELALRSGCQLVAIIGRILIYYKENEDKSVISQELRRI